MLPINNANVECVGSGHTTVATQDPSLGLPPILKKSEHKSFAWKHFTKVEGGDLEDPKSKCNYCGKLFSCHSKRLELLS